MNKLALVSLFASVITFSVPFIAEAQFEYACNPPCASNQFCDSNRTCVLTSTVTQPSGGGSINMTYLLGYKNGITGIINGIIVPVLIAIAFLVFLWGVFKYFIWNGENESEKAEGRKFAMWGIIGLVIIFAIWGIVNLVGATLNLNQAGSSVPRYPTL